MRVYPRVGMQISIFSYKLLIFKTKRIMPRWQPLFLIKTRRSEMNQKGGKHSKTKNWLRCKKKLFSTADATDTIDCNQHCSCYRLAYRFVWIPSSIIKVFQPAFPLAEARAVKKHPFLTPQSINRRQFFQWLSVLHWVDDQKIDRIVFKCLSVYFFSTQRFLTGYFF